MLIDQVLYHDLLIHVVRDDLYPLYYGGNKARKISRIRRDILSSGANAVVTTGGILSNHCRVVALLCAAQRWRCKLILHGDKNDFYRHNGNAYLMRLAKAECNFVKPEEIGETMDAAMAELEAQGLEPYYLYGGGHTPAGVGAYACAVEELGASMPSHLVPDHIFLASGTGSTQAGILAGLDRRGWQHTHVHGISVAREKARGERAVSVSLGFVDENSTAYGDRIHFYDEYLFGGYAKSEPRLDAFVADLVARTGIVFDTTYTGKAFMGMLDLIERKKLKGTMVFWHTGGLLNLIA